MTTIAHSTPKHSFITKNMISSNTSAFYVDLGATASTKHTNKQKSPGTLKGAPKTAEEHGEPRGAKGPPRDILSIRAFRVDETALLESHRRLVSKKHTSSFFLLRNTRGTPKGLPRTPKGLPGTPKDPQGLPRAHKGLDHIPTTNRQND